MDIRDFLLLPYLHKGIHKYSHKINDQNENLHYWKKYKNKYTQNWKSIHPMNIGKISKIFGPRQNSKTEFCHVLFKY